MQENPIITREDVTVSLNKDLIDTMLGIAEVRGITFSMLIRDILGAFCKAYRFGTDWTQSEILLNMQVDGNLPSINAVPDLSQTTDIISRLEAHGSMIAALQARVSLLESQSSSSLVQPGIPAIGRSVSVSGCEPDYSSGEKRLSAVIDCDHQYQGGVSEEALVKSRPPVSPVITSVDVSGIGRINPEKSYTQTEAAVLLSLSISKFRKIVKEGRIPLQKVGRNNIFQGRDLITFLNASA